MSTGIPGLSQAEERRRFLREWADQNPDGTIAAAQRVLKANFNQIIKSRDISEIMKAARQKMKYNHTNALASSRSQDNYLPIPALTPTGQLAIASLSGMSPQAPGFVQALTKLLQLAGIRKIEIKPDGTASVEIGP